MLGGAEFSRVFAGERHRVGEAALSFPNLLDLRTAVVRCTEQEIGAEERAAPISASLPALRDPPVLTPDRRTIGQRAARQ